MRRLAPYQLFFPFGLLNAILAVGVWFVQELNWFAAPVIFIHGKLIMGGFLWSFIVGFLMTAVPKMTATASANRIEYVLSSLLMIFLTLSAWHLDARFYYALQALVIAFMIIYGGRRLFQAKKSPPVFFSHVALAMFLAVLGCYYHFTGNSFLGIHLYHVGPTLLLVLGIGTRFFSFLSGLPSDFEEKVSPQGRWLFHISGVVLAASLFLAGTGNSWAYLALAIVSLSYLLNTWRVLRTSARNSALKYAVRVVALAVPLSFLLSWMSPSNVITWLHLIFIGCFGLLTFSVATRVTLAHGAYGTDLELSSRSLWWLLAFILLAIVSRLLYGFSEDLWRKSFLHLAATFWVLAVGSWAWAFLPRIFLAGPQAKPSC